MNLTWIPTARGQALVAGEEVVARLNADGAVELGGKRYVIAEVGSLRPRVLLRPAGGLAEVAALDVGGEIHVADASFTFERVSAGGVCAVRDRGVRVMTLQRDVGPSGPTALVQASTPHALVLAVLCWHVLLRDLEDPGRPVTVYNGGTQFMSPRSFL